MVVLVVRSYGIFFSAKGHDIGQGHELGKWLEWERV